jgi:hypothetical protein
MVGAAFFVIDGLRALIFFGGAKTARNVGIGSSLRDPRFAYDERLQRTPASVVDDRPVCRVLLKD